MDCKSIPGRFDSGTVLQTDPLDKWIKLPWTDEESTPDFGLLRPVPRAHDVFGLRGTQDLGKVRPPRLARVDHGLWMGVSLRGPGIGVFRSDRRRVQWNLGCEAMPGKASADYFQLDTDTDLWYKTP